MAIGCTGYPSHDIVDGLAHHLMQILSNGFTIGCLTAIALHLILPVSLPTQQICHWSLVCVPLLTVLTSMYPWLQHEEGGEDKYVHAVAQGAPPPHTPAAAYVCMCALSFRKLTSAVCSYFVARVLNCKDLCNHDWNLWE